MRQFSPEYGRNTLKTVLSWLLLGPWFALLGVMAHAEVRLANIFGEHMVLQRQQAISVWGWATPGEAVRVKLHRQVSRTVTDVQGRWRGRIRA